MTTTVEYIASAVVVGILVGGALADMVIMDVIQIALVPTVAFLVYKAVVEK